MTTVIVKWTGPYSRSEVSDGKFKNGLYLITGCVEKQKRGRIQYCGITEDFFQVRFSKPEHPIHQIRESSLKVWLGKVVYPSKSDRSHLEIAEHCFVSFWQTPLNKRKIVYCPKNAICLISQWHTTDDYPRRFRLPIFSEVPDVLWWDEERWRTGRLEVHAALP